MVIHVEAAAVGSSRALERDRVQGDLFVRRLCNAGGAGCTPANAADRRAAAARSPEHQGLTPATEAEPSAVAFESKRQLHANLAMLTMSD